MAALNKYLSFRQVGAVLAGRGSGGDLGGSPSQPALWQSPVCTECPQVSWTGWMTLAGSQRWNHAQLSPGRALEVWPASLLTPHTPAPLSPHHNPMGSRVTLLLAVRSEEPGVSQDPASRSRSPSARLLATTSALQQSQVPASRGQGGGRGGAGTAATLLPFAVPQVRVRTVAASPAPPPPLREVGEGQEVPKTCDPACPWGCWRSLIFSLKCTCFCRSRGSPDLPLPQQVTSVPSLSPKALVLTPQRQPPRPQVSAMCMGSPLLAPICPGFPPSGSPNPEVRPLPAMCTPYLVPRLPAPSWGTGCGHCSLLVLWLSAVLDSSLRAVFLPYLPLGLGTGLGCQPLRGLPILPSIPLQSLFQCSPDTRRSWGKTHLPLPETHAALVCSLARSPRHWHHTESQAALLRAPASVDHRFQQARGREGTRPPRLPQAPLPTLPAASGQDGPRSLHLSAGGSGPPSPARPARCPHSTRPPASSSWGGHNEPPLLGWLETGKHVLPPSSGDPTPEVGC